MKNSWIDWPENVRATHAGAPLVLASGELSDTVAFFRQHGATTTELALGSATSPVEVIEALRQVLPLPQWCGSSWDSIDDAIVDVASAWPFPLVLVVRNLEASLERDLQLALNTVLALASLAGTLGQMDRQMEVLYVKSS